MCSRSGASAPSVDAMAIRDRSEHLLSRGCRECEVRRNSIQPNVHSREYPSDPTKLSRNLNRVFEAVNLPWGANRASKESNVSESQRKQQLELRFPQLGLNDGAQFTFAVENPLSVSTKPEWIIRKASARKLQLLDRLSN